MSDYVLEPKKIKERIKLYERRLLHRNLKVGPRAKYMIGPYYLMLNDTSGALKHFEWLERQYPDLPQEPFQGLCWVLTLIRVKQFKKAIFRLKELHLTNVYLIPNLIHVKCRQVNIKHLNMPWSTIEYLKSGPLFLLELWREEELKWLKDTWLCAEFQDLVESQLQIDQYLLKTKDPEERKLAYLERAFLVSTPVSIYPMRHLRIVKVESTSLLNNSNESKKQLPIENTAEF
jgi:hypothetical protein